jgi:phosphoglycerate dehydrogenase-like enzyme
MRAKVFRTQSDVADRGLWPDDSETMFAFEKAGIYLLGGCRRTGAGSPENSITVQRMKTPTIFSDCPLSRSAERLLKEGVAPHKIIFPGKTSGSVLSKSGPDPAFATADVAFGQPDVASVLRSKRLRWIHLTSAGYTRYDTPEFRAAATARRLRVTNSSTVYAEPCAEHVVAFMLAHARKLPLALRTRCVNGSTEWNQLRNASLLMRNQNVVLLGIGAIGSRLVEMLRPFRMQITALRRQPKGDEGVPVVTQERLPEVLAHADHVVNILPDNPGSVHFISAERFALMKRGAVFYNIGRGKTVDQDALLVALRSGHLDAAWLDVTDPEPLPVGHPLLTAPNCFLTPHTAGGHQNESETLVRHFLDNFHRFLDGSPLRDRVM